MLKRKLMKRLPLPCGTIIANNSDEKKNNRIFSDLLFLLYFFIAKTTSKYRSQYDSGDDEAKSSTSLSFIFSSHCAYKMSPPLPPTHPLFRLIITDLS